MRLLKLAGSQQDDDIARSNNSHAYDCNRDEKELVEAAGKKILQRFLAFSIPNTHADGKKRHLQRRHHYILQIDSDAVGSGVKTKRLRAKIMLDEETITGIQHEPGDFRGHQRQRKSRSGA